MTCYRNSVKCMLLLLFMGLAALNTYSYWRDSLNVNILNTSMHPDVTVEQSSITPFQCPFEPWNQLHSDTVPYENLHLEWIQNNISRRDNILESQIRLLSSFVYLDHISITTNSQRSYGQKVYCRYYNCLREEISNSSYQSIFFPMNVIRCPRRIGVKYMSISFDSEEIPQEPIPLVYRVFEAPIHEVSVCVGPIYGSESKWLEVAEFIEHYKLIGVRYFYFTVFNMNEYSRKIIDEYLRTGEIELTVIQSEYKTIDWQFHLLQINECHQRSKHHSKWVINVDIDERLVILDDEIKSVGSLLSGYNDTVAEVGFAIRRIQKTEKLPEKYESDEQIISEMEFLKYNVSSPVTEKLPEKYESDEQIFFEMEFLKYNVSSPITWGAYKTIYRPNNDFRSTEKNILGSGWLTDPNYKNFSIVPEETKFAEKLKENVLKKIKYVYDQRKCERNTYSNLSYYSFSLLQYPLNYLVIEYQLPSVVRQESEINVRNSVRLFSVELNSFIINSRLTAHVNQPLSVVLMMGMRILEAREVEIHREDSKVLVSFFSYRQYRTTEKNILGSGWLTDSNYKNFSIVPEETEFAEKLKENVLKKIKYVYDQRVLYCEEIAEIPYEEYKEFGHDIFNCRFRNDTGSNKSVD
ncbi:hypothetical protein CRE_12362 [Caenorhabditis remanei]|uniref:Glycosyltransferase family 92 protein n=1 Tax=Caenorhabditis remanei TaxID=31234 RepID=E3NLW6_CAERE|nr:hypothetical protein CRE_12362 [Caenorhabditis remanei]